MSVYLAFFLISFGASILGSICGIGGGVVMKPVLDAFRLLPVSAVSFLSGCTVLSMALISVGKTIAKKSQIMDFGLCSILAVGAAAGGMIGKNLFQYIYVICPNENRVGAIQAFILLIVTAGTFAYTLKKEKICTWQVSGVLPRAGIGILLGMMSSFLGIGGGPINLVVLHYFFSMDTKLAASCSLYIILFSQLSSLLGSLAKDQIPEINPFFLLPMVLGGVLGGLLGSQIHRDLSARQVNRLFIGIMLLIMGICVYNLAGFLK